MKYPHPAAPPAVSMMRTLLLFAVPPKMCLVPVHAGIAFAPEAGIGHGNDW